MTFFIQNTLCGSIWYTLPSIDTHNINSQTATDTDLDKNKLLRFVMKTEITETVRSSFSFLDPLQGLLCMKNLHFLQKDLDVMHALREDSNT